MDNFHQLFEGVFKIAGMGLIGFILVWVITRFLILKKM